MMWKISPTVLLRFTTLALVVLFPISWTAPLMRAGLLPLFGLSDISVLRGIGALWTTDPLLAVLVALFALVAPILKLVGMAAIQWNITGPRYAYILHELGRFAMADIFLIALYIAILKGTGFGRVETAWGLYLFSFCVLASLACSWATERANRA